MVQVRFLRGGDTSVLGICWILGVLVWGKIWGIFNRIWGIWQKSGDFGVLESAVGLIPLRAKTDFLDFGPIGHN